MTVTTTTNTVVYVGNNSADTFPFNFLVLEENHLVVRQLDATTRLEVRTYAPAEYTVTGIGDPAGSLTLVAGALSSDYAIEIQRIVPYTQETDIVNQGGFYPDVVENQFDLGVMQVQQLAEQVGRAIKVPSGESGGVLPSDRAGMFLAFNVNGNPVAASGTGTDSALRTDLAAAGGAALVGVSGGGSVQDALDALTSAVTAYTAGSGGDFATLINALDYFKTIPLLRPTTLTLTGTHTIPDTGYVFDHPQARNLYITGPAWTGGQRLPTNADMSGTKATDLATVAGLSSARLILAGTDTGGTNGYGNMTGTTSLDLPYGIGGISRLMVECHNRYGVSVGFSTSHSNAQGNVSARFSNCAFVGGIWPVIGKDAFLSFDTANWFGYYIDGGAFGVFGGYVDCDAGLLEIYCPPGDTAYNPKYGLYFEGGNFKINSNGLSGRVKMKGPILHGIYAVGGAGGECRTVSFDTVTQPITIGDASINVGTPVITNADPANSTLRTGSTQPGVPGNEGSGALVSVGPGGSIRMNGATITSSVAAYALFIQGGEFKGYGTIALSGSSTTNNTIRVTASKGNVAAVSVATSLGGSVNQVSALQNGDIFLYSASGVVYSPALNTPTNGAGIYN